MPSAVTRTTCPYCGVGCGVTAEGGTPGTVTIAGDRDHPANHGRLCSKGSALGETLSHDDRLLHPLIDGARATWDQALTRVAQRFSQTIADHGPDAVAFYVSGQLLTEDYYVANKLMKGYIGSGNIDTNSRLCMASSVAGHRRAFGADTVPGVYEDLELADLVVLVGSNLAWCHPVLYQRLAAARSAHGTRIVVIDPRQTTTCEIADLHLPLAPGTDVALFNGLLSHLLVTPAIDHRFIADFTAGLEGARAAAVAFTIAEVAAVTELAQSDITRFYDLFAATPAVVTAYSQGVNQSTAGTDKVNAIINCHLATGRIGRPGMGPFSLTGQPNAMGGREVGGLANMLAAHMEIENPDHRHLVQTFWGSPRIAQKPGLKAVDMFRAVADGRIKALWIMATNPVDSMPEADHVRNGLERCPFVVVSDVSRHTDTTAMAHVLLPSQAWGEKNGTVTNSERRISRQRAFLAAPGSAQADWWQMAEVAKRMGHGAAFAYDSAADVFIEHATLSAFQNNGSRDFDIGGLAALSAQAYDELAPIQWPCRAGTAPTETRFFAKGQFFTPDRRGNFVATPYRASLGVVSRAYPLILNTGRVRDQWHTMTRTGKAPRLLTHVSEPFLDVHPDDASAAGLSDGGLARVRSAHGSAILRTHVTPGQRRGSVFAPIHWTGQLSSAGRIDAVVAAHVDPVSGQPGLKFTAVAIEPFAAIWHALIVCKERPSVAGADYWALAPVRTGWRAEFAGTTRPDDVWGMAKGWLGLTDGGADDVVGYQDDATGSYRYAVLEDGKLAGIVFLARSPLAISRSFVADRIDEPLGTPAERLRILAGRPGAATRDRGAIVCSCFEVGFNEIVELLASGQAVDVDAIGTAVKAGTNCGSCRAEIGKIIKDRARVPAQ